MEWLVWQGEEDYKVVLPMKLAGKYWLVSRQAGRDSETQEMKQALNTETRTQEN